MTLDPPARRAPGRRALPLVAALALPLVAALAVLAGCGGGAPPAASEPPTRPVRIVEVGTAEIGERVRAVGLLAPKDEARLSFKQGGVIERLLVEEGAAVRRGQLLATIRATEIDSGVEQARAAAEKARRDLERGRALYADGVAAEEQVQNLATAYEVARAALRGVEFNAGFARIEAPADGVVLRRLAEPNELVSAGQPVLVVGGTDRGWIVRAALADRDVVHVAVGQAARVNFDAWPGRDFEARVRNVASAADPATGTFTVELQVEPGDARFVQGLVAKVSLAPQGARRTEAVVLPLPALLEAHGDNATVFVVDPQTDTARRISVRIGRVVDGQVEVLAGVAPGQQVVVDGAAFLADGEAVRIATIDPADAGAGATRSRS